MAQAPGYGGIRRTVDTLGCEGRTNGQSESTVQQCALKALQPGEIVCFVLVAGACRELEVTRMRTSSRLAGTVLGLAAAQLAVAVMMWLSGNPEGWMGGILYAAFLALPQLLIALALHAPWGVCWAIAGWAAVILGALYALVVVGNWSGYSYVQAIFVVVMILPTVAVDLLVFWATVLRRPARPTAA